MVYSSWQFERNSSLLIDRPVEAFQIIFCTEA